MLPTYARPSMFLVPFFPGNIDHTDPAGEEGIGSADRGRGVICNSHPSTMSVCLSVRRKLKDFPNPPAPLRDFRILLPTPKEDSFVGSTPTPQ